MTDIRNDCHLHNPFFIIVNITSYKQYMILNIQKLNYSKLGLLHTLTFPPTLFFYLFFCIYTLCNCHQLHHLIVFLKDIYIIQSAALICKGRIKVATTIFALGNNILALIFFFRLFAFAAEKYFLHNYFDAGESEYFGSNLVFISLIC